MAKTRIYFVSDLHGSSVCFRKFINAAKIYEAKVMILGGDVAGKAIQSIVRAPGGHWKCRFIGTDYDVVEGPELAALEKLIADHGYYAYRADPGELEAMEAAGGLDDLFLRADARAAHRVARACGRAAPAARHPAVLHARQ